MSEAKFSLGIDLGTTHCALSYVDLADCDGERVTQQVLPVPQLTAPGNVAALGLLPSFIYLPHASELAAGDLDLPWSNTQDFAVGEMARSRGAGTPIRRNASRSATLCEDTFVSSAL
jgi:molecular chaperone DnaK (HSP70)